MDHGAPGSYLTLTPGTDVVSSDGETVGKVEHVLADEATEIFDGLVIDTRRGPGGLRFVDAPEVDEIFERAVVLSVTAAEVDHLPEPTASPGVIESHGEEDSDSALQGKLRRAWDLISGRY
jgi:sporulation protein YlmC with PRC-barrel domain